MKDTIQKTHSETFEVPSGHVVTVNQNEHTVWLNLGSADGLRSQISFSVFNADVNAVQKAERKARIEITRVIDQHLSEARIVEDDLTDPILRGDVVYSPAWRPGVKVRFALAGFMDINGDGKSDRELVRNVITLNGGVIDSELKDDGTVVGKLDAGTRFFVQGDSPTVGRDRERTRSREEILGHVKHRPALRYRANAGQ